jgi:cell division protein FtsB
LSYSHYNTNFSEHDTQDLDKNIFKNSKVRIPISHVDDISDELETRKPIQTVEDIELIERKQKRATPKLRAQRKNESNIINWLKDLTLLKICWLIILMLCLRLVFMERGIWDFYQMENRLSERQYEIDQTKIENIELQKEILRIKNDKNYQKQLARDHLGVIAENEYLVIFANDSDLESN